MTRAPRNLRHNLLALGTDYAILAPVAAGAPLAAGLVADTLGFEAVFAAAAGFGLLSLTVLGRCVWDPRRIPLRETPSV